MREIITLQLGACGNQIGETFWDVIADEHGINPLSGEMCCQCPTQEERLSVYFNESCSNRAYARALVIDTDPTSWEQLMASNVRVLYNPELCIVGTNGTGNNFARGFYTDGTGVIEPTLNNVRLQMEQTDTLQGFQIIHSIGGGTGSGVGSLLIQSLADEYPSQLISTFTVIPSERISDVIVEPYNSVLSFPQLIDNAQLMFCMDNEALFDICDRKLRLENVSMKHINHIVAHAMSGVTTCLRFPGQLNAGLRKLYVNMVPFPPLHFFVPGFAPLTSCRDSMYLQQNTRELVNHLFDSEHMLAAIDFRLGKLLTVAAIFRGIISPQEIDELMMTLRNKNRDLFVDWIPNSFKTAICDIPPCGLSKSSTFIGNTTAVSFLFKRIAYNFDVMMNQRAHLHWYTAEGMDLDQFAEARYRLKELIYNYKECEDTQCGDIENELLSI